MADWDVVILSDQLVVRALSSHAAWAPGPLRMPNQMPLAQQRQQRAQPSGAQPPATNALTNLAPEVLTQFNVDLASIVRHALVTWFRSLTGLVAFHSCRQPEPQRTMVVTICQRTGLNIKFAVDCLEGNGWDIERAVANFGQVKVCTMLSFILLYISSFIGVAMLTSYSMSRDRWEEMPSFSAGQSDWPSFMCPTCFPFFRISHE